MIQQIKGFLEGNRKHPLLKPSIEKTSDAHIESLAAYYSKLKTANTVIEQTNNSTSDLLSNSYSQLIKQGESIYSSCSGCHGIKAEGIPPYPRLAGQQTEYLKQQLIHFKTGERSNALMKMMTVNLSNEEIEALSLYLSSLSKTKYKLGKL